MFPKPRIVISKCIGFDPCRYNGEIVQDKFVARLEPHVEFVLCLSRSRDWIRDSPCARADRFLGRQFQNDPAILRFGRFRQNAGI